MVELPIVYENKEIILINKPAGIAAQGGSGIKHSVDTILPEQLGYPVYLVHRLDRATSGLLLIAKESHYAAKWTNLITSKEVKKEYAAFCIGTPPKQEGYIDQIISHKGQDKTAGTHYTVISLFQPSSKDFSVPLMSQNLIFSLLHLQLDTGRMHQIRIHLSKNNCPIAADDKYGNFKLNKEIKKYLKIKTLMLCAKKISIPIDGKNQNFEIPYPPHMEDLSFAQKLEKLNLIDIYRT